MTEFEFMRSAASYFQLQQRELRKAAERDVKRGNLIDACENQCKAAGCHKLSVAALTFAAPQR